MLPSTNQKIADHLKMNAIISLVEESVKVEISIRIAGVIWCAGKFRCFIFSPESKINMLTENYVISQGLLEFIWMEGYSGQSSNPGLAMAILVL